MAEDAISDTDAVCPELARGDRCKLFLLAIQTGGRFGAETSEFIRQLAGAKALSVPRFLRAAAATACERRWSRMLAMSVASAHTASLLLDRNSLVQMDTGGGIEPWLETLLTEAR